MTTALLVVITACAVALTAGAAVLAWQRPATQDIAPAFVTIGALVLATAVLLLPDPAPPSVAGTRVAPPSQVQPASTRGAALELVQLADAISGEHLTVSGRVHNPADGPTRSGLSAVVIAIDDRGSELATGEGPVDPIEPGGSSTFTVALPAGAAAARYRVSFRQGMAAVPHVDRRPRRPAGRLTAGVLAVPPSGPS